TMSDRENLQKHYYEMLINNSKEVAISFVNSNESSESRFLKQLGIKAQNSYDESDYAAILFTKEQKEAKQEEEIIQAYSFKDIELSPTRLKTFLTCKRKYYFSYIKHIKGHDIPRDMPKEYEIGNAVHSALKELYSKRSTYDSVEILKKDLHKALDDAKGESELDNYLIAMQKKRMDSFCEKEIQRFSEGWQVVFCEESRSVKFAGMTLVGQIDRIDKRDKEIEVLDYKTGSYTLYNKNNFTEATDFQLEFYYLLAGELGNVSCAFYDLKESKIVPESFLDEKLSVLESNIKDLLNIEEVNFSKCEDTKPCQFCEYAMMCGR
ncbi:MAG: PD-(D/E)XK nuclease family protein, partial [Sulfurimonas sp.]